MADELSPTDRVRHRSRSRETGRDGTSRRKRSRSPREDRPRKRRSLSAEERPRRDRSPHPDRGHPDERRVARRHRSRSLEGDRRTDRHRDRSPGRRDRGTEERRAYNGHKHRERDDAQGHRQRDRRRPQSRSPSPPPMTRSAAPLPSQNDAFQGKTEETYKNAKGEIVPKEQPNYRPTGLLAAAANTVRTGNQSIILKYHEPAEARKPPASSAWRMYIFKDGDIIETIELHTQSCWLVGREAAVVDVLLEHTSCSKQHAVLQFRHREEVDEWGERKGRVRLYVLDLESANGTRVNDGDVEAARYVEVKSGDVLTFGHSTREYMIQLPPKEQK